MGAKTDSSLFFFTLLCCCLWPSAYGLLSPQGVNFEGIISIVSLVQHLKPEKEFQAFVFSFSGGSNENQELTGGPSRCV